ncbi:hybrid sensor histidine kinase/response regulator [Salinimonas lutimaris]|uniref:hybrid sensor histidine kinase/response regulator n=1 Tax=Salinimonas lutimaris TaxID=914153 RepID=UPI0015866415|nr:ATP-binding protein [Salinimonas lutimaris]
MQILRELSAVSSDPLLPFEQKITRLLQIGCEAYQMEVGAVGGVSDATYEVEVAHSEDARVYAGLSMPLSDALCMETYAGEEVIAYPAVSSDGVSSACVMPPKFADMGCERYIGIPLYVDGRKYGTVCFFSARAGNAPFDSDAHNIMILMAEWISAEFNRRQFMDGLKLQQQQLAHQSQLFDQMATLAGVGSWEYDIQTDQTYWSEPLRQMYELPDNYEVSTEQAWAFIADPQQKALIRERFDAMLNREGEGIREEIEVLSFTGRPFWIEAQCKVMFKNGQPFKVIGASQDVTSRVLASRELKKKKQEAEKALQSRSLFLANMSHEIRTPINGVIGMLAALGKTTLTDKQAEFRDIAAHSADNLLNLINDILDFSKIDSGQMQLEMLPVNISTLIREQQKVFAYLAVEKNIELLTDISETDNKTFYADPVRLRQILTNLTNNALKFTREGYVKVRTRLLERGGGSYLLQLTVEDTGMGIEPEHQAAIFSPFQQGDSATTRQFGGTGLGLSIVSQIAELMEGGVKVKSTPGEGASFIVTVKLQQADAEHYSDAEESEPAVLWAPHLVQNKRVLVVEDNEINQIVITEQLRELGIEPELVNNGSEAVEQVVRSATWEKGYDLIFMDCQMPIMDGYEATAAIRKLGETGALIPIIALTANALAGEREKCVLAGMNDYLTKPVSIEQLGKCIRRYLI